MSGPISQAPGTKLTMTDYVNLNHLENMRGSLKEKLSYLIDLYENANLTEEQREEVLRRGRKMAKSLQDNVSDEFDLFRDRRRAQGYMDPEYDESRKRAKFGGNIMTPQVEQMNHFGLGGFY